VTDEAVKTPARLGIVLLAAAACALPAAAQSYPTRPIRMIVPYPAGASTNDILGRALAPKLAEALGQNVVVDNRPGAGGNLGSDLVAKALPDGHTLLLGTNGPIAVSQHVYSKLPYDPLRDLAPVAMFALIPYIITIHPSVPAASLKELIALAKAKPGHLHFASAGNASTPHLCGELLKTIAGIDIVHVPYKGGALAMIDTVGGQTQIYCTGLPSVVTQIKAGKLRGLAVTTLKRSPLLPEMATAAEQGLPGFDVNSWNGFMVPARTPQAIVSTLQAATERIMATPETKTYMQQQGADIFMLGPREFGDYLRNESEKWAKVVRAAKVRVD
jgi:tripartite-type tricarboxylate transporter receptor subunit TctC